MRTILVVVVLHFCCFHRGLLLPFSLSTFFFFNVSLQHPQNHQSYRWWSRCHRTEFVRERIALLKWGGGMTIVFSIVVYPYVWAKISISPSKMEQKAVPQKHWIFRGKTSNILKNFPFVPQKIYRIFREKSCKISKNQTHRKSPLTASPLVQLCVFPHAIEKVIFF